MKPDFFWIGSPTQPPDPEHIIVQVSNIQLILDIPWYDGTGDQGHQIIAFILVLL